MLLISFIWLVYSLVITASSPPATPFIQDRFVISFWVDPIVDTNFFVSEYQTIAFANFTALMGGIVSFLYFELN